MFLFDFFTFFHFHLKRFVLYVLIKMAACLSVFQCKVQIVYRIYRIVYSLLLSAVFYRSGMEQS